MQRCSWTIFSAVIIVIGSMLPLPLVEAAQADAGSSLLERLINGADAIAVGTAVEQSSYWNDERTRIYTSVILSVEEMLKGTMSEDRIAVILPGGEVDEVGEWVSHIPGFGDGERALVFLKELSWAEVPEVGDSAPQLPEKQFQILCNSEAKLSIVEDRVGDLPLNTFKEQINRVINGQALSDEELDVPVSVITSPYSYLGFSFPHPPPPVVEYRINENTSDCIGEGAAVQAAAATWNAAGALFSFSYAGTTTAVAPTSNGVNEIMWRNFGNDGAVALTHMWYYSYTNDIAECDVEFNDYYAFSTAAVPPSDRDDVQTVGLHEFGHWLALDDLHNPGDSAKVMYYAGSPGQVKRTLHADDIAGIRYIYGVAQAPPNAPSNPSPANHAAGVSITADLSWIGGDPDAGDTVTYDAYFGTSSTPPLVSNDQSGTMYDPGTLAYNAKYYWKVVATDNHGASTTGPLWDFTTTQDEEEPFITLSPSSGVPGTNITVQGSDFTAGEELGIYYYSNSARVRVLQVETDGNGHFKDTFIVPESYTGPHEVRAYAGNSSQAAKNFTVIPGLTVKPEEGPVGTNVTVEGHGFAKDEEDIELRYYLNSSNYTPIAANIDADEDGWWKKSFLIPLSAQGSHNIDAEGEDSRLAEVKDATFRVMPGSAVTWNLPWGLDADPAAVDIWTYPGDAVAVILADVDWSMPLGLLIWYYGGPTEGWRFYKKGWGSVNTLETLIPGKGYIGIVPTAGVWEIPQG